MKDPWTWATVQGLTMEAGDGLGRGGAKVKKFGQL